MTPAASDECTVDYHGLMQFGPGQAALLRLIHTELLEEYLDHLAGHIATRASRRARRPAPGGKSLDSGDADGGGLGNPRALPRRRSAGPELLVGVAPRP